MATKKGPTKGSGGKHRNSLRGKGPTPKAEDRVYHKAYKAKKQAEKRQRSDPRLAARRRAAHFTSNSDDLVIGVWVFPPVCCTWRTALNTTTARAKSCVWRVSMV